MSYELRASGCEFLLRNFSPQRHRGTERSKIILLCGSVTPWFEYLSRLFCFVDPLPSHHRLEHFHISNFRGVDLEDVVAQKAPLGISSCSEILHHGDTEAQRDPK